MCKEYKGKFLVGSDLDVIAIVGEKETKEIQPDQGYGNIIGISIGETYTRAELGQIKLTLFINTSSKQRIVNVPLTQFLPDGERQMYPIDIPKGSNIRAKLDIQVAGLIVAKPIPLIFHCDGDGDSC